MVRPALVLLLAILLGGCGEEHKRPHFSSIAVTYGKSMLPAFSEFEMVMLEHCKWSDLKAGDTVIYWNNEHSIFVHHRILARDKTGWKMRGDNNPGNDVGIMTADEFVGRTHKMPFGN